MEEYKETISPNDLVLRLSEKANNFDISKYEDFIGELCGKWEFQIEAIRKTVKLFLSGEYKKIEGLVRENFKENKAMQEFFRDEEELLGDFLFKDKLSCTIDLATGTGKTWVINALLIWQYLNARREEKPSGRYSKNFLLVAPGLIVYERLLDAFLGKENEARIRDVEKSDFKKFEELFSEYCFKLFRHFQ